MSPEPKKRPRRVPFTPEEVANIIEAKRRREQLKLQKFRISFPYKAQNVFNVICFFIYWEVIFCFFGPANYYEHYSYKIEPKYGDRYDSKGVPVISEMDIYCVDGVTYTFIIDDFAPIPPRFGSFFVGRDFLLQKNLKGRFEGSTTNYRLFAASPILLLILLTLITSTVAYTYNLNENSYSLMAVTVLNALSLMGLLVL